MRESVTYDGLVPYLFYDDVAPMLEWYAGVECDPPEDKPYGVRMVTVTDPAGYQWGFMLRTG